jgi:hypothetical protein
MGCDIHSFAEVRREGRWTRADVKFPSWDGGETAEPFEVRDYGLFGFLADVRNYSHSPVITEPRGIPDDADLTDEEREEFADGWYHSASWLTLAELLAYDYDQVFWDRRVTKDGNGAALAEGGEGEHLSLREFLGQGYFDRLDLLAALGRPEDVRVAFWFDN